jgi:hypothetical protein
MKHPQYLILILLIALVSFSWSQEGIQNTEADWTAFSKNLVRALGTSNEGLQISAMSMVVRYGEYLDVNDAVFNVVRIFRNSKNPKIRQLALVTLHKMQNKWAMGFLKRNLKFEENETILNQSRWVIHDYLTKSLASQQNSGKNLLANEGR